MQGQVLLLEAGPWDKNLMVQLPLGSSFLQHTRRDWDIETEKQPAACQVCLFVCGNNSRCKNVCVHVTLAQLLRTCGAPQYTQMLSSARFQAVRKSLFYVF
jgi:hypothetical protein